MKKVQRIQAIAAVAVLFVVGALTGCQNAVQPMGNANAETSFTTSSGVAAHGPSGRSADALDVTIEAEEAGDVGAAATEATIQKLKYYIVSGMTYLQIRVVAYPNKTFSRVVICRRLSNGGNGSIIKTLYPSNNKDWTSPLQEIANTKLYPYGANILVKNSSNDTIASTWIGYSNPQ